MLNKSILRRVDNNKANAAINSNERCAFLPIIIYVGQSVSDISVP